MKPSHIGEGTFRHSLDGFKCYSLPETPSQKHPPLKSHKCNQHKDHKKKGTETKALLRIQGLVLLALGMVWILD